MALAEEEKPMEPPHEEPALGTRPKTPGKVKDTKKAKEKKSEVMKKDPKIPEKETPTKPAKKDKEEKKPKKTKSKSKTVMKSSLKKPSTNTTMKKPAAAGSSSKSKLKAVKDIAVEGEEEEPMDDDPVSSQDCFEAEETTKDRSKWAKFKKLLDQGSLPDFIKKAYQEAQKLKTGKEKAIRQIVNNVLDRDPKNGSLVVNLESPALKCFKVG